MSAVLSDIFFPTPCLFYRRGRFDFDAGFASWPVPTPGSDLFFFSVDFVLLL